MRGEEEKRRKMKGKGSALFALMAVIMIMITIVAMSATASADTGIVRPDGDVTYEWAGSTGINHYTEVDEAVEEPTAGDTADYVYTGIDGSTGEVEEFDMGTISGVESVSNVKVWMYAKSEACNGGECDTVDINVYMGGAYQTALTKTMSTSWTWYSASFDGSWTQADLDALKVQLTRNAAGKGGPTNKDDNVTVATVYVNVTYAPSYSHTTKINVSCEPTDFKRCESTDISGYLTSDGVGFGGKTVNLSFRAASQYDAAYDMISPDDPNWHQFASVTTESDGSYYYSWNPADENPRYAGWHAIKASFDGEGLEYSPSANTTGYSESPNLFLNFSTLYIDCYTKDHGGWPMFEVDKGTLKGDVFVAWNRTISKQHYADNQTWTLPHGTLKSAYYFYGEWGENGECVGDTHHLEINGQNVTPMITGKDSITWFGGDLKYQPGKHTCGCCVADCECTGCDGPSPRKDLFQEYGYSVGVSGCGASYIALNLTNAAGVINMGEPNNFKVIKGCTNCRLYGCFLVVVYENSSLNYTQYWINQGYVNLNADGQWCDCGHETGGSAMHSYTNFAGDLAGTVTNATLYYYGIIGHAGYTDIVEFNGYEITTDTGGSPVCAAYNVPTDKVTSNSQVHQYIPSETDDYNYRGNVWILKAEVEGVAAEEPSITSYAPDSPVNDTEGASRTFNITVDQIVNVSWQINGTEVQTNTSETEASYTNTSASAGVWNVSAIVNNANGTDMQTWIWNVTGVENVVVTVHNTSFGNMLAGDTAEIYISLTLNNTGDAPADIYAVFKTNVSEIYGLNGNVSNIIPGNNFELGRDTNEKALTNTTTKRFISTLPAGQNVTYDAILTVPAGQTADDYSGIVELSW